MQPPSPSGNRPAAIPVEKLTLRIHWLLVVLLAAAYVLVLANYGGSPNLPGRAGWPEALLIGFAAAGTIAALARQLPLQNVLLAASVVALLGGAVHALGGATGIPFGPFLFGADAGPQLFKALPWAMPLVWVVAVLNSRGVVRLILRPWRKTRNYGLWLIGLTAVLATLFDLAFDPFASRVKHYWLWMPTKFPVTWQGAPVVNFMSWAVVTLLMLVFITPALINKNPHRSTTDYHPLAVWLGGIVLFGFASAAHGMPVAVVVDGIIAVGVATFAIRGGRW
jgi:uncharacterized membrane protein